LQKKKITHKAFLEKLPKDNWQLQQSLQQNEMFILGMHKADAEKALAEKDYQTISNHLYRVQKISNTNYVFRHHLETELNDSNEANIAKRFYSIRSISAFEKQNPIKVSVNNIGKIVTTAS